MRSICHRRFRNCGKRLARIAIIARGCLGIKPTLSRIARLKMPQRNRVDARSDARVWFALPVWRTPAGPGDVRSRPPSREAGARDACQPLPDGTGPAPWQQAGYVSGDIIAPWQHSQARSLLSAELHSMPPTLRITPPMCWPIRLSKTGCHGTLLEADASSIMATQPLAG